MPIWILECPNCGASNRVTKEAVIVRCGTAQCSCACVKCKKEFTAQQEYWRWLGLEHGPASQQGERIA